MNRASQRASRVRSGVLAASLILSLAMGIWALGHVSTVGAQEKPAAKTEAVAVVSDLEDIERLRVLNALKMQPDQVDKLIAALATAQAEYDRKVNDLGSSIFASTASEVRDVKKKMLGGAALPKDFEDKMKKLQIDFLKKRDDLNVENIKSVGVACRIVLTDTQVATATRMERELWEKEHPDAKGATDNQLFNLYCVDMFISNPRIVPLLKEVKAATPK